MPRFGISDNLFSTPETRRISGPISEEKEYSPSPSSWTTPKSQGQDPKSVRLSCLSLEGRQWHSILRKQGRYVLISRVVEESGDQVQHTSLQVPPILEAILPKSIQDALALDPPLEIFCVEAEGTEMTKLKLRYNDKRVGLPRLCVYSNSSLFVIQAAFDSEKMNNYDHSHGAVVPSEIVSVTLPFQEFLLRNGYSTRILRARPAPQRSTGHSVHSPSGCLTVLTEDRAVFEYKLLSLESNGQVKEPVFSFRVEQTTDGSNRIVDFCFAQSNGLSLLSSLSILLLKASGDVMAASPFVFNGTLVPRLKLEETMEYIRSTLGKLDRSQPKWRQYRAASQYLIDVFPRTDRKTQFVAAKTARRYEQEHASAWPLQIQGPILFKSGHEESDSDIHYSAIENFGKSDLVGFCVASSEGRVDIGVTSPTTIIPRFSLESRKDSFVLDDVVFQSSAWVEKVALGLEGPDTQSISLYQDPNYDSLIHFVSNSLVASITSNCVRCAGARVREGPTPKISTDAWNYMEHSTDNFNVQGVVAFGHAVSGNQLLIQLANGHVQNVNVSQKKESRELGIVQATNPTSQALLEGPLAASTEYQTMNRVSEELRRNPAFHEWAPMQIAKVNKGLASMARIVESETKHDEISPEMLAVVASIQERCENEVVLPVLELAKMIRIRREALPQVLEEQKAQIMKLMEARKEIERRNARIRETLATAETNARNLKSRTNAALAACKDFVPKVTAAETQFFRFVELMEVKAEGWENDASGLRETIQQNCSSVASSSIPDCLLSEDLLSDLKKIASDTGIKLTTARQTLKDTELKLNAVLRQAGMEAPTDDAPTQVKP